MDLDIIFLGTAASTPTARRATSATLIRRGGERILVDCGEATQQRLLASVAGLADLDTILLTHVHLDHVLGLPGLLTTFGLRDRTAPLSIYGPPGTRTFMNTIGSLIGRLEYPCAVVEVEPGGMVRGDGYHLEASGTIHRAPSVAWSLVEDDRPGRFDVDRAREMGVPNGPLYGRLQRGEDVTLDDGTVVTPDGIVGRARRGRRLVFSGDTRPCDAVLAAAVSADVLVHEATFLEEDRERARTTRHSTAAEAARLALDAGVVMLVLNHVSTRYPISLVKREARAIFPGAVVPRDFDRIVVPTVERGEPVFERGGGRTREETAE